MIALIDADILPYEFGNMKDLETEELLAWEITRKLVDDRINGILDAVDATHSLFYLTDSKSNFRNQVATILPYKGHRTTEKPPHWQRIRQHLIDNYDAEVQYGVEADDAMGIKQYEGIENLLQGMSWRGTELERYYDGVSDYIQTHSETIICSRDKDMDMIPGWHYSWECGKQAEKKWFVDEQMGIRSFYKQLLTGDTTDNILGLYGVGKAAACVKRIDTYTEELDMFEEVWLRYEERYGNHAEEWMWENAALLWILREYPAENFDGLIGPEWEVHNRLRELHDAYQEEIGTQESKEEST